MRTGLAIVAAGMLAACGGGATRLPPVKALSAVGARDWIPTYSPDGKHLAFWRPTTDSAVPGRQLWVANADLSGQRELPATELFNQPAVWSPDGTRLAFSSAQVGLSNVAVVPFDSGPARLVTHGTGVQVPVSWYADGDRIVTLETAQGGSVSGSVVSASTGRALPLIPGETRPYVGVPSPDGSMIAVNVFVGSQSTIWVADSAGRHARQLTSEGFEGFGNGLAANWSPDSKSILYESRRTGHPDIWVVPAAGGAPRQLTHDVRSDYDGAWSPDGKWIAFLSDRGGQVDVWLVPSAGGQERRVTDSPDNKLDGPLFRPGTSELAFTSREARYGLWTMDLASGAERQIVPDTLIPANRVSPDGSQVAVVIGLGGNIQALAIVPITGGAMRTIIAGGGSVEDPSWSPDGTKILFGSDRGGSEDIWVVDAASGALRRVTDWPGYENQPAWKGDGSAIYFVADRDSKLGDVWSAPAAGGEPVRLTHAGNVSQLRTREGTSVLIVQTLGDRGGQFAVSRVLPDGSLRAVYDRSNAVPALIAPGGDSVVIGAQQPDGQFRIMLVPVAGGAGRMLLPPNTDPVEFSPDGRMLTYAINPGGQRDVAVLNLADGSSRRLTKTPADEGGGHWTRDEKTLVFARGNNSSRIVTVDVSKLMTPEK
jgi:Tol biopolymer transport system component